MTKRKDYRAWCFVDAADPTSEPDLATLTAKMTSFYAGMATQQYWDLADASNETWTDATHPYHRHLAQLVAAGSTVVDFGCGSAHAIRNLNAGIQYTGIEGSDVQVARNRERYPNARFFSGDMLQDHGLGGQADWCI